MVVGGALLLIEASLCVVICDVVSSRVSYARAPPHLPDPAGRRGGGDHGVWHFGRPRPLSTRAGCHSPFPTFAMAPGHVLADLLPRAAVHGDIQQAPRVVAS